MLTVLVPTYNGERHLAATLDSLQAQDADVVVMVVDDGSTDGSVDLARSHGGVDVVLTQVNRGVAAARNRGLATASSRYVAFVDQDDLWHPTRAQTLLDLAQSTGAAAVGTTEQAFALTSDRPRLGEMGDERASWCRSWIDDGGEAELLGGELGGTGEVTDVTLDHLMQGATALTAAYMYDREAAIISGGCAPFVRAADDHVLNVNLARIFGAIPKIDRPGLFYRVHPEATTNASPLVLPLLTLQLALRYGRALPREADLGPNLEHLIWAVDREPSMTRAEQLALITLSVPPDERRTWVSRWAKRSIKQAIRGRVSRP